jgi:hypothetical protein
MEVVEGTHKDPRANTKHKATFFLMVKLRSFNTKIGRVMITRSSNILRPAPA